MGKYGFDCEIPVGALLEATARRLGDREALVFEGVRMTFREWDDKVNTLAVQLEGLGLEKGDRVAIGLPNCVDFPIAAFAAAKLGAITVPVNLTFQPEEVEFVLKDTGAKILVTVPQVMGRDNLATIAAMRPRLPGLAHVLVKGPKGEGTLSLDELLAAPEPAPRPSFVREGLTMDDPFAILYSGGTTGLPKGVLNSSFTFLCNDAGSADAMAGRWLNERDSMIVFTPMFMAMGFRMLVACVGYGVKLVGLPRFDPRLILQTIQDEKITYLISYPTLMRIILGLPTFDQYDVSSVRIVPMAGEPISAALVREVEKRFGARVVTAYGGTECSGVTRTQLSDPPELIEASDGRPCYADVELKLVDEQRHEVPFGEVGEIAVRGRGVFGGYWNRPQVNAEVFDADGWFYFGDLARYINADRYIRFVGRKKDMIRRGMQWVYPEEIENCLKTYPKVANVGVIGVPGPHGERIRAYVQLRPGQTATPVEVVDHCCAHLSANKIPDEVRFLEELPLSPVRKVQRFKLREEAQRERK